MKPPREPISDDFESDPLWDLLGKANSGDTPRQVSPFFARNVVREIRRSGAHSGQDTSVGGRLLRSWRLLTSSVAVVTMISLLYGSVLLHDSRPEAEWTNAQVAQLNHGDDLEVIKNLDELLDENSVWLESTASAY